MKHNKLFFMDCNLAGRKYYDADEVWDKLCVGTRLRLQRDANNPYDPNAVAVMFDEGGRSHHIGFIPRTENGTLAALLEMGWTDVFECRINQINPDAHCERQVMLTIRIVRRPEEVNQANR